ncbi:MAG: ferredoxin-4 [archaeon]|jgi:ferredoxin
MAKLINHEGKKEEVKDGDPIKSVCMEKFQIPFACEDGLCGTCLIYVIEGMENLSERNDKEKDMGLVGNERLACQCRIKKGIVSIKH